MKTFLVRYRWYKRINYISREIKQKNSFSRKDGSEKQAKQKRAAFATDNLIRKFTFVIVKKSQSAAELNLKEKFFSYIQVYLTLIYSILCSYLNSNDFPYLKTKQFQKLNVLLNFYSSSPQLKTLLYFLLGSGFFWIIIVLPVLQNASQTLIIKKGNTCLHYYLQHYLV